MEARIIELEIKFSHQEEFISQLNKIVVTQQARIEKLEKELLEQKQSLDILGGSSDSLSIENSKPPHY